MSDPKLMQGAGGLYAWACDAKLCDITYHRTRKYLWDKLCHWYRFYPELFDRFVPRPVFNSVKSALTSRNEHLTDDKRLAFDTAVAEIEDAMISIVKTNSYKDYGKEEEVAKNPKMEEPEQAFPI